MESLKIEKVEGNCELTIREGMAIKPLELCPPIKTHLSGVIDTPAVFVENRYKEINQKEAHVIVNRDNNTIILVINEKDGYTCGNVQGTLKKCFDFEKFNINTGHNWTPFDLADFIKMNRSFFIPEVAKKLVETLRNFTAKVDTQIEKFKDDKANYRNIRNQAVNTNAPDEFQIQCSIFIGQPKQIINVEIVINPDTLNCVLISPEANDIIAQYKGTVFDTVCSRINSSAPDILIIEQ